LAIPLMAWFAPRFARLGGMLALSRLLIRRIRRRRPVGSQRVLREASLQRFHTRTEVRQFVLEGVHIGLDCRGGVFPVLRAKGETVRLCFEVP
jgi:hypothetical protein